MKLIISLLAAYVSATSLRETAKIEPHFDQAHIDKAAKEIDDKKFTAAVTDGLKKQEDKEKEMQASPAMSTGVIDKKIDPLYELPTVEGGQWQQQYQQGEWQQSFQKGENCPAPTCCVDQLDCNCHLPCTTLGSGQLCAYNGGSRATQEAANIVVPDRFYNIDAISCQDQSTAGNQVRNTVEVGTRSFQIQGEISVKERYDQHAGDCKQAREKTNACYHREEKRELCDNAARADLPCVCEANPNYK